MPTFNVDVTTAAKLAFIEEVLDEAHQTRLSISTQARHNDHFLILDQQAVKSLVDLLLTVFEALLLVGNFLG